MNWRYNSRVAGLLAMALVWKIHPAVAAIAEETVSGIKQALLDAPPSGTHRASALEAIL